MSAPAGSIQPDVDELPLVSIIIPAYNVEEWVAEAVDSALAQTYPRVRPAFPRVCSRGCGCRLR